MAAKSTVSGILILCWNAESFGRSNGGVHLRVRNIRLSKPRTTAGSTVKMQSMLMMTPFARASPMSAPMVKLMNTRASSPAKVVRELPVMAPKERDSACRMASCLSDVSFRCWR